MLGGVLVGSLLARFTAAGRSGTLTAMVEVRRRRARRVEPSDVTRAGDTLADPDYVDTFEIDEAAGPRSAEQWARSSLEDPPRAMRWFLLVGWRLVLRLRLGPRGSPDHVLGWTIVHRQAEAITLGAESAVLGPAQLVFRVTQAGVTAATFLHFERRGARAIWSFVGPIHRQVLPHLLSRAANRPRLAA